MQFLKRVNTNREPETSVLRIYEHCRRLSPQKKEKKRKRLARRFVELTK